MFQKPIQNIYQEISNIPINVSLPKRRNCDGYINQHGHDILEICKSLDLRILNERTKGDTLGKIPFHGNRGVSTFDYIITNSDMYD